MKNVQDAKQVQISAIQVPDKYRRRGNVVEDDKLRQSIELTVSPAKLERNVLAFDVSALLEALAKSAQILREGFG